MKVIQCEQPGVFKTLEQEKPALQEGHAIVKVQRVGICGTDLHAYRGRQPFFTYPRILGHELSGVIEQIGASDARFAPGDPVAVIPYLHCGKCRACQSGKTNCCTRMQVMGVHVDGGMREWISVPTEHLIKAEGISSDGAAIVECLSIGAHAVRRANPKPHERVLVIGAGPIGLGVMIYAKLCGASKVAALDMVEHRLAFCKQWANIDATLTGDGDVEAKLRNIFDGDLPDIVFDATGNQTSMETSFHYAEHGGRVVYVGLVNTDITFHDPLFHSKELTLMASRNATREDFMTVMNSMREGRIDVDAFVTHRAAFEEMIDRFDQWLDPASQVIKAMLVLD